MSAVESADPLSVARLTLPMTFTPNLIIPSMAANARTLHTTALIRSSS
jgi:hypothetical protein